MHLPRAPRGLGGQGPAYSPGSQGRQHAPSPRRSPQGCRSHCLSGSNSAPLQFSFHRAVRALLELVYFPNQALNWLLIIALKAQTPQRGLPGPRHWTQHIPAAPGPDKAILPVLSELLPHGTPLVSQTDPIRSTSVPHSPCSLHQELNPHTPKPPTFWVNRIASSQATLSGKPCSLDVLPMSSPKFCLPSAVVLYQALLRCLGTYPTLKPRLAFGSQPHGAQPAVPILDPRE